VIQARWGQGMKRHVAVATLVLILGSGCASNTAGSPTPPKPSSTTPTTTTTDPLSEPFAGSVNDLIAQINIQLPLLAENESATPLPMVISADGTFGGQVTSDTEIRIVPAGNAFDPVLAVVVRTEGTGGSVQTPARLLSGIGGSLYALSIDAVTAFNDDVLPRLSVLDQTRTTITVGSFYDLTIIVVDPNRLSYIFTPVGVAPPADLS
jgi:hypothetical protein